MSAEQKQRLHDYLAENREAMTWKAEGLSEYDERRPLTPTGTNLLGLIKHLSTAEAWYLGQTFGRPFAPHLPWWDDHAPGDADLWVTASETRSEILGTYRAATAHADETIRALDLDAPGRVPWCRNPMSRCTPCSCTSSPRPLATPDTPTSCANNSTGAPGILFIYS